MSIFFKPVKITFSNITAHWLRSGIIQSSCKWSDRFIMPMHRFTSSFSLCLPLNLDRVLLKTKTHSIWRESVQHWRRSAHFLPYGPLSYLRYNVFLVIGLSIELNYLEHAQNSEQEHKAAVDWKLLHTENILVDRMAWTNTAYVKWITVGMKKWFKAAGGKLVLISFQHGDHLQSHICRQ